MKFKNYLNEDDSVISDIKRECSKSLKIFKKSGIPFYRGVTYTFNVDYVKRSVRTNRKPRDMDVESQQVFDDIFQKRFGWKPRSQGLFCVADPKIARDYGNVGVVIPCGDFKYLWNPDVEDLFKGLSHKKTFWSPLKDTVSVIKMIFGKPYDTKEMIRQYTKGYKDNDIFLYFKKYPENEIMIQCKDYYVVSESYWNNTLKKELL